MNPMITVADRAYREAVTEIERVFRADIAIAWGVQTRKLEVVRIVVVVFHVSRCPDITDHIEVIRVRLVVPVPVTGLGEYDRLVLVGVCVKLVQVIRIYPARLGCLIVVRDVFNPHVIPFGTLYFL